MPLYESVAPDPRLGESVPREARTTPHLGTETETDSREGNGFLAIVNVVGVVNFRSKLPFAPRTWERGGGTLRTSWSTSRGRGVDAAASPAGAVQVTVALSLSRARAIFIIISC